MIRTSETGLLMSRLNLRHAGLLIGLVAASCQAPLVVSPAAAVCADEASAYAGTVGGAFVTTVGYIRDLMPRPDVPPRWPNLDASYPAVLCYIDGQIPISVIERDPDHPTGDRVVIGVLDGDSDVIMAGYRELIPIRAP